METRSDLEIAVFDDDPISDLDVTAGHAINDYERGTQPAIADQDEAWGNIYSVLEDETGTPFEPFQVAGLGAAGIAATIRAIRSATVKQAGQAVQEAASKETAERLIRKKIEEGAAMPKLPQGIPESALDVVKEKAAGATTVKAPKPPTPGPGEIGGPKYIEAGGINIQRHHEGAVMNRTALYEKYAGDPEGAIARIEQGERVAELYNDFGNLLNLEKHPPKMTMEEVRMKVEESPFKATAEHILGLRPGLMDEEATLSLRYTATAMVEKADSLMLRIANGDTTPETLAEAAKIVEAAMAFTALSKQNSTGIARALNIHKEIAGALNSNSLEALSKSLVDSNGSPETIILRAQAYATKKSLGVPPDAAMKAALKKTTWFHALVDLYKSNQLSSMATHFANFAASALLNAYHTGVTVPTAAVIGVGRKAVGRALPGSMGQFAEDSMTRQEVAARITGAFTGVWEGFRNAGDVLLSNESAMEKLDRTVGVDSKTDTKGALGFKLQEAMGAEMGGMAETALTVPFRLLKAGDEVTRTIAYREAEAGLAVRQAIKEGLEPGSPEYLARVNDILTNPTNEDGWVNDAAVKHSKELALQDRQLGGGIIGKTARAFTMLSHEFPLLGLIAPYVTTPANIPIVVMEHSPLAPLTARWRQQFMKGGVDADIAISKMVMGSALLAIVYGGLYAPGKITGNGPESPDQKKALEGTGWQPWSIVMDEKFLSMNRLQPASGAVLGMAAAFDKAKYAKEQHDAARIMLDTAIGVGEQMLDSTFLQSMNNFLEIFTKGDPMGGTAKFVGKTVENFIPYSALLASITRGVEAETGQPMHIAPKEPKPGFSGSGSLADFWNIAAANAETRLPGLRSTLPPKRYWDGEPVIPVGGMIASTMSPVTITNLKKDPASVALVANGVSVRVPDALFTVGGVTVNLMDFDNGAGLVYDRFIEVVGNARREAVNEIISSSAYADLNKGPQGERALALSRGIEAGLQAGKARFLEEFAEQVKTDPKKYSAFAVSVGQDFEAFVEFAREGGKAKQVGPFQRGSRFTAKGTPKSELIRPPGF